MKNLFFESALREFNPWWETGKMPEKFCESFWRDTTKKAEKLLEKEGVLVFHGPRQVGKTTAMRQLIQKLLLDGTSPARIVFVSADNPLLTERPNEFLENIFQFLEEKFQERRSHFSEKIYLFLDEVQMIPRWELLLKVAIDQKINIRFVVSGSASQTIFRQSLENLTGRSQNLKFFTFSFSEMCQWKNLFPEAKKWVDFFSPLGDDFLKNFDAKKCFEAIVSQKDFFPEKEMLWAIDSYFLRGGVPALWRDETIEISSFVVENFVRRVILEDLALVREIRKPMHFARLFSYFLAESGSEYNASKICQRFEISRVQMEEYLPLFKNTNLVFFLPKFSGKSIAKRISAQKFYALDPAFQNGLLQRSFFSDAEKGNLAEILVLRTLLGSRWAEIALVEVMSYFRDKKTETDFLVPLPSGEVVACEVKFRENPEYDFPQKNDARAKILVSKKTLAFDSQRQILSLPLPIFCLLFP